MRHLTTAELELGLPQIRRSPADGGAIELIVRRPEPGQRELLQEAELDIDKGLLGDGWHVRPNRRSPDGGPHPDMQLTLVNSRATALIAQSPERWALAGDQLYVDLDLSEDNLPAGTRLTLGSAVVEVTGQPHTGCAAYRDRFGADAMRFVNSAEGRRLHLRGINARVVASGSVRRRDLVHKA
jgi:hypothetical protein